MKNQRQAYARNRVQRAELWERTPEGKDTLRMTGELKAVLALATKMIQAGCRVSVRPAKTKR